MYNYEIEKQALFTDDGQRLFIGVRDQVRRMLKVSGAVRMGNATQLPRGIGVADGWVLMAAVDRLVELKEIREIPQANVAGQHRVFVAVER